MNANNNSGSSSNAKQFQIKSKNLFLTYPKCSVPLSGLLARLRELCPSANYYCVSSEKHESGELHRHAYLQFKSDFRTRDKRYFDVDSYHPNIQGARNTEATLAYVKKDNDFIEHGLWTPPIKKVSKESVSTECVRSNALEMSFPDFLIWCSVNKVMYAKDIWTSIRHVDVNTITSDEGLSRIMDPRFKRLLMNMQDTFANDFRPIVMVGASGIGKTNIAKIWAPKPCLFVSHIDTLKEFKAGYHKSIIFDDVSFTHTPITNQIAICDSDNARAIHCRHRVAHIPANVMKYFTCNEMPLDIEHPAIARRIILIRCQEYDLNRVIPVIERTI